MFSELTVSSQVLVNPGLQQSGWAHNLYEVVFPSGQDVDDGRARYGRAGHTFELVFTVIFLRHAAGRSVHPTRA